MNLVQSNTKTVKKYLEVHREQIASALPMGMNADRMARLALTEIRKNDKLAECSPESFFGSIIQLAQMGLEPVLGGAYLVPFKGTCTVIIGYRGMLDLAYRSDKVLAVQAHAVYEKDTFSYQLGSKPMMTHIPAQADRGKTIAFYGIATLRGGVKVFEVMHQDEMDVVKANAKKGQYDKQKFWNEHPVEMSKKTVIRKMFKYLPISIEMTQAITLDEQCDDNTQDNSIETGDAQSQPTNVKEVIEANTAVPVIGEIKKGLIFVGHTPDGEERWKTNTDLTEEDKKTLRERGVEI